MNVAAIFSGVALFVSLLTLWLTHLRGVVIALSADKKCEMPEILLDEFKPDIPTTIIGTTSLFVLNKGNRTGAMKVTKLDFVTAEDFANFLKKDDVSIQSIESHLNNKFHLNHSTTLPMTLIIKDGSADLINIVCSLKLNQVIKMKYEYNLENINIESNDLRELLNKLLVYKEGRLKEFINFLRSNENFGKIRIYWEYTKRWVSWGTLFEKKIETVDVGHSYKETIKYYEDARKKYHLDPLPNEIIKSVLLEIDRLKTTFNKCRKEIEHHSNKDLFGFSDFDLIKSRYIDKKNSIIELLKKCGDYKEIIKIEKLLKDLLRFHQETGKAANMHQGDLKQKLIVKIKREREPLKEKLISGLSTLENLRKAAEHELEEKS